MIAPASSSLLARLPAAPDGRTGWPWTVETARPADVDTVQWPRITIVTPSYQQAGYLEECLRSVLLQNYPNLEYLVLDGGSTDGSARQIERYAPHLAFWQSRPDHGQADAINQGFARATGDILGWLNSDDFFLPGALVAVGRAFLNGRADIVYGDAWNFYEEDRTLRYWQAYWIRENFLQFGGLLSSHATFWRRTVHVPIWADLNCNIDGELWQRLVPGRRLRYLPLPLGVFRAHAETKSSAERWREKWRQDDAMVWARHGRPTRNRLFLQWYAKSQRIFKWFTWRRNVAAKRAVLAACLWPPYNWRGPSP
jgi:glycosyltransferase involved in cell wall biosynthesis